LRILIINTDYRPFLRGLYDESPGLALAPYEQQLRVRNESLFGVADFYSGNFIVHGHEAWEVHANNGPLQTAWMAAHGLGEPWHPSKPRLGRLRRLIRLVGERLSPPSPRPSWTLESVIEGGGADLEKTLITQIHEFRPDIILNQAVSEVGGQLLHEFRQHVRLIVGQIASPLPEAGDYSAYDLMISSLPNYVGYFQENGVPAELNRLAFEPRVLDVIRPLARDIPVSFVGSVTPDHRSRFDLLEYLAVSSQIAIWGRVDEVPAPSPIRRQHRGTAWGTAMYRVLARSKITINQHIDIAEGFANNMRLFEATGMGTLLITDWKHNIVDMFEPGKEVICYHSASECVDLIHYYLTHEDERARIAEAGQQRTLRDHTYRKRTAELSVIFQKQLQSATRRSQQGAMRHD
jgi:spore maturation protein CgeB